MNAPMSGSGPNLFAAGPLASSVRIIVRQSLVVKMVSEILLAASASV
jgi:hypothetical protein